MANKKPKKPDSSKVKFWNPNKIISISAISISVWTLLVLLYQTRVINQQFELARETQYASALPYLELTHSFTFESYEISLVNTGVGPAFIKKVKIMENGDSIASDIAIFLQEIPVTNNPGMMVQYSNLMVGKVIPAGQELIIFKISNAESASREIREYLEQSDIRPYIEYASIYDHRWAVTGLFLPPEPIP